MQILICKPVANPPPSQNKGQREALSCVCKVFPAIILVLLWLNQSYIYYVPEKQKEMS